MKMMPLVTSYLPIPCICAVEYEDMSKKQLMTAISKLERRLDKADAENTSLIDMDDRRGKTEGKEAQSFSILCY